MTPPRCLGRYTRPRIRAGDVVRAAASRSKRYAVEWDDWTVTAFTTRGRLRWPCTSGRGGTPRPLIFGDLLTALQREAASAVVAEFGVSRTWVTRARRALKIDWRTEGTLELWSRRSREVRPRSPKTQAQAARPRRPLTAAQVEQIRRLHAEGAGPSELARRYHRSPQYVGQLVRRERARTGDSQ